ncbi:hypothetical protein WJX73_004406 [Symbiochloris irregularis]|uniref:Pru domain-containing protein n=1 Tax=Symbiochloris irregularis TaxID=706552 RepID=A0AAW1NI87_9CHLO
MQGSRLVADPRRGQLEIRKVPGDKPLQVTWCNRQDIGTGRAELTLLFQQGEANFAKVKNAATAVALHAHQGPYFFWLSDPDMREAQAVADFVDSVNKALQHVPSTAGAAVLDGSAGMDMDSQRPPETLPDRVVHGAGSTGLGSSAADHFASDRSMQPWDARQELRQTLLSPGFGQQLEFISGLLSSGQLTLEQLGMPAQGHSAMDLLAAIQAQADASRSSDPTT